jgi:hypothetical protein
MTFSSPPVDLFPAAPFAHPAILVVDDFPPMREGLCRGPNDGRLRGTGGSRTGARRSTGFAPGGTTPSSAITAWRE